MSGRRVFISYQHGDIKQAQGFNLLRWNNNVNFEFVGRYLFGQINSETEAYIRLKIREQMKGTSCTVVLIGKNTHNSVWVNWEIEESISQGKAIIGIFLPDCENEEVPEALIENGCTIIEWDPHKFGEEIEKECLIVGRPPLEPPASTSRKPKRNCIRV